MSDREPDIGTKQTTDLRFDDWPVLRYETWENWNVEDETPVEKPGGQAVDDVEWIGYVGGGASGGAILYEPGESALYRGEVDEENERVILDERHDEPSASDDSLGGRLEAIGEEHGWTWLSSFAREHLEDEGGESDDTETRTGFERDYSEFQQRNVLDDADPDVGFFGAHTFADASGRKHMLERDFDVYFGDGSSAAVQVLERYLVAEEPRAEERQGDAELVDERAYELDVDVDEPGAEPGSEQESEPGVGVDDPAREHHVESTLEEWHEKHLGPPGDEPDRA